MAQWAGGYRNCFLDELLCLEGCGAYRHQTRCGNCDVVAAEAPYRCKN
jgi:hypothetical protein